MKKTLLIIAALSISLSILSQDKRDTLVEKALLWEITGNGLSSPSYMFGTHHLTCESDIILPPVVLNKVLAAKIFFIETLYGKGEVDSSIVDSRTKEGSKKLLGKICFRRTKELLEGYYGPLTEGYIDSLSTVELVKKELMSILRCRVISYDDSLYNIAKKNNLDIRQLETIEQLRVMRPKGIEYVPGDDLLCNYVNNQKSILAGHIKRKTYYNNHDINWLYNDAAYDRAGDESNAKAKYIDGRNALWLPRIESAMKEGASFFAFGCAHLPGRKGIISLLRKQGYTVTPIFY